MYGTDRTELRAVFFRAWRNHRENRPLAGVERLIVDVALAHPEYHAILEAPDAQTERDYLPALGETNPFLHIGLHIAVAEQLTIDQPPGVRACFQRLCARLPDTHAAEHAAMECLEEMLARAHASGQQVDQSGYLDCLNRRAQS